MHVHTVEAGPTPDLDESLHDRIRVVPPWAAQFLQIQPAHDLVNWVRRFEFLDPLDESGNLPYGAKRLDPELEPLRPALPLEPLPAVENSYTRVQDVGVGSSAGSQTEGEARTVARGYHGGVATSAGSRPDDSNEDHVTSILRLVGEDAPGAAERLLELVYDNLRAVAGKRMAEERSDHTLQATALVHEAWMRLFGDGTPMQFADRGHFFRAAAQAMRRILIQHARGKGRLKRGGRRRRVPLSALELADSGDFTEILSVDEAIQRLGERDPRMAEIVSLRFFSGLSEKETALVLGLSDRTVRREWVLAKAWLSRALEDEP